METKIQERIPNTDLAPDPANQQGKLQGSKSATLDVSTHLVAKFGGFLHVQLTGEGLLQLFSLGILQQIQDQLIIFGENNNFLIFFVKVSEHKRTVKKTFDQ